jgi:hypothetical protein
MHTPGFPWQETGSSTPSLFIVHFDGAKFVSPEAIEEFEHVTFAPS